MDTLTAYAVLGLQPGAAFHEVKLAWRTAVRESHPDSSGGDLEAFAAATAAFNKLRAAAPSPERPTGVQRIEEPVSPWQTSGVVDVAAPLREAAERPARTATRTVSAGVRVPAMLKAVPWQTAGIAVVAGVACRLLADRTGAWSTPGLAAGAAVVAALVALAMPKQPRWPWAVVYAGAAGCGLVYGVCAAAAVSIARSSR